MNVDMTHATTGATCLSVTARTYNMSHTRKRRSMSQHEEHVRACSAIVIAAQRMVWASAGRRTWMLDGGGDVYSNVVREEALGRGRAAGHTHDQHTTCDGLRHVRSPHKVRDAAAKVASRIP